MEYGFENDRFYVDMKPITRTYGNMREETDYRMRELASVSNNLMLSLSGGLDSQCVLHSCVEQGIPIDCAFMYLPGYNDNEYQNMQIVAKKYGIKPMIIDIDVDSKKEELLEESMRERIYVYSILWKHFLEQLPSNCDLVQMTHDPYCRGAVDGSKQMQYVMGLHLPDITRDRAMKLANHNGKFYHVCDSSEFLLSILDDDIFKSYVYAYDYYAGNGLYKQSVDLKKYDCWDYYVKPMFYGKYWRDELIYFPKFVGFENVDYLIEGPKDFTMEHCIIVDYFKFVDSLKQTNGDTIRFYANRLINFL